MFPKFGPLIDAAKTEVPAVTGPAAHWASGVVDEPLERINKENKRRSRVVEIFPNEASVIRLGGAVLADMHDEWQASERRYRSEGSMANLDTPRDTDTVAELNSGDEHRGSTSKPHNAAGALPVHAGSCRRAAPDPFRTPTGP